MNETLEHKIQNQYNKLNTQTLKYLRGVYSDTTQLNSTDLVEQRTANQREASQSCFCL